MRIAVLNQKGGVGKTSLTLLIGAILQDASYDVMIEDEDPQETATFFARSFGLRTSGHAEVVIVDTPGVMKTYPGAISRLKQIIATSDRLLLVTEKSPASIHSSLPMAQLISGNKRPDARAFVLFNKVRRRTIVGQQRGATLAKELGLPALRNEVPLASSYENAFAGGLSMVAGRHRSILLKLALELMKV